MNKVNPNMIEHEEMQEKARRAFEEQLINAMGRKDYGAYAISIDELRVIRRKALDLMRAVDCVYGATPGREGEMLIRLARDLYESVTNPLPLYRLLKTYEGGTRQ